MMPKSRRGRMTPILLAATTAWAVGLGCGAVPSYAQQPAQAPAPAVLVTPAAMQEIAYTTEFVGRVKAIDRVDIRVRVTGFLGPRLFKEGDKVETGQILFTIDPAPFEAVAQQKVASVQSAQASVRLAEVQANRARELARTEAGSRAQLDQREADLARANADLALAEASLREAAINLSYTKIASPITGRVSEAAVTPGNLVSPDTGVLATVVSQTPMHVTFSATHRQILEVRRETPDIDLNAVVAKLRLADGSIYEEKGTIDFLGVRADPKTDSVPLRAVIANPKQLLDDGMSVRVLIETVKPERVLLIPQAAILLDQAGSYVFVVGAGNKAEIRRIKSETRRDGSAIVYEGLKEGDSVIVQGQARVRPGLVVAPSPMPGAKS